MHAEPLSLGLNLLIGPHPKDNPSIALTVQLVQYDPGLGSIRYTAPTTGSN